MNKSITKVINTNNDRIMIFDISDHHFIAFTVFHSAIIVIEHIKDKSILLCNRTCSNRNDLTKEFDKVILTATKAKDADDFISKMDTYIGLNHISIHNETTEEIIAIYNIILKDYNS